MASHRILKTDQPHSFYDFIEEYCLEEKYHQRPHFVCHRLCSLMRKMRAKTVVVETLDLDHPEIVDEYNSLRSFFGRDIECLAYRFSFSINDFSKINDIFDIPDDRWLSSSILINIKAPQEDGDYEWKSYLYKSIVAKPKILHEELGRIPLLNNYLTLLKEFKCEIEVSASNVHAVNIYGTYFCQQNTFTSVCAHAVLCMAINNSNIDHIKPINSKRINDILGIDHVSNRIKGGISHFDINLVLNQYGLSTFSMDFLSNPDYPYNWVTYGYLESRCPIMLIFTTRPREPLHTIFVCGHTLNSDLWEPEARRAYSTPDGRLFYSSSSDWVDHFIIHDDNFGMYLCMPISSIKALPKVLKKSITGKGSARAKAHVKEDVFKAEFAFAIIPQSIDNHFWEAEYASVLVTNAYLSELNRVGADLGKWLRRISSAKRPQVVRTILMQKKLYASSLQNKDFDSIQYTPNEIKTMISNLPDLFWLSEISNPDLFLANKTKLIDFIYPTQGISPEGSQPFEEIIFKNWLQIRMPGALLKKDSNNEVKVHRLSVNSHYPLIEFNSNNKVISW